MHARIARTTVTATIVASILMVALSACSQTTEATDGQGTDVPMDVLVRGAEPGGMTDTWEDAGGAIRATLGDDGKAFYKSDGEETSGMWLMSSPTDGELMLTDGRSFKLSLDEETDELAVIDMSDGSEDGAVVAALARVPGDTGD